MIARDAFLLTRQWRDTPQGIEYEFWFVTDTGPVQIVIDQQEAVLFVLKDDLTEIERHITLALPLAKSGTNHFRIGETTFKNCFNQIVIPLYFSSYRFARDISHLLFKLDIDNWEADIKPTDRYLMERFITGGAQLHLPTSNGHQFKNNRILPSEYRPQLKMCSLDIETSMDAKQLYSIAVYTETEKKVFMIGVLENPAEYIQVCNNQKDCLLRFFRWLEQADPDVLIGWSLVQFDLWVLENLCRAEKISFPLGRNKQTPHWREDSDRERHYMQVGGRIALDGIELLRAANYTFHSFSLETVSRELLGEGKLAQGSGRVEEIQHWFENDKNQLAKYNLQDCKLVWDIFVQEQLMAFAIERSHLTGLALDRSGGSVAAFEFAYLPLLHRKGYVAPNLGEIESDVISPGGYVMDSVPGIFNNVLVLDFKSLYPSIIRTFCIDPYAFWVAEHEEINDQGVVPGFNGAQFSKEKNILPGVIEKLWAAREKAKADSNGPLSHAIKIIMNSFYGVLGSTGCRFFDPRVCSSITLRGHEIIQQSKRWIEKEGFKVIYGDTDSVFVWIGDNPKKSPNETGHELAGLLNKRWRETLAEKFAIESALEIEFETHYQKFLMPTIRNSKEGSKKRYAGVIFKNGKNSIVFKGLENVRTDWTLLAKQFQEALYQKVFDNEPVDAYVQQTVNQVLSGASDEKLIYRKRLRRKINEYVKNVPPHIQAARKYVQWSGKTLKRGDWIEYVITLNGPEPVSEQCSQLDYQHYIDKQLAPIADGVLHFIDLSFADITARQMGLFG